MSTHSIGIRTLPFAGDALFAGTVVALTPGGLVEAIDGTDHLQGDATPLGVVTEDSDGGEAPVWLLNCAGTIQVRAGDDITTGDLLVLGDGDTAGHLVPLDGDNGLPIAIALGDAEEDALCEVMFLSGAQLMSVVYEPPEAPPAPAELIATDDDFGPVNGTAGDPNVGNALDNDTLNGAPVDIADITVTVVTPATPVNVGDPVPVLDTSTGIVSVPAGTPADTYTIEYEICEDLNPTNCDTATITVEVEAGAIDAVDDDFGPVNGTAGDPNAGNALDNDTLNGAPVDMADITVTVVTPATPVNVGDPVPVLDTSTGIVSVPAGTPDDTYTIVYKLTDNEDDTNTDTATVTITVGEQGET